METPLSLEIRRRVAAYLSGESTLGDLQAWLVPATWDLNEEEGSAAALRGAIELALAEYTSRHRSVEELQEMLRVATSTICFDESPQNHKLASSAKTDYFRIVLPFILTPYEESFRCQDDDIRHVKVSW